VSAFTQRELNRVLLVGLSSPVVTLIQLKPVKQRINNRSASGIAVLTLYETARRMVIRMVWQREVEWPRTQ
jgi:hypothetical protein